MLVAYSFSAMKQAIARFLSRIFIFYYKLRYGAGLSFGQNVLINHKFKFKGPGQLKIGPDCNLWAHSEANEFYLYDPQAQIEIGANSRLNGISCHCAQSIKIGQNCLIGSATIMDTDFHSFTDPSHILFNNPQVKPVQIGDGVWLCGQSAILKGSQIGAKSVVGFRSIVAKSFPANVVIAGNPAQIIKSKSPQHS